MKMRIVRNRFLLLFVLGGVLVSTGIATAGYAVRYLEETYDDTDCDPGDDTNDDREFSMMTYRWYAYMGYQNYSTATVIDDYFREPALTDPDCEDWGRDYSYIELADIAFVGGHGNTARRVSNGPVFYRLRQNEIYDDDCKMWPDQQMRLGEGASDDIEILHMYSCHSMTIDNNAHINTWHPVFGGLHQVDGLHGNGHVGLSLADDFYWLARSGSSLCMWMIGTTTVTTIVQSRIQVAEAVRMRSIFSTTNSTTPEKTTRISLTQQTTKEFGFPVAFPMARRNFREQHLPTKRKGEHDDNQEDLFGCISCTSYFVECE